MVHSRVWLILACWAAGCWGQKTLPHTSPCPAVYSYGWDPAAGWYGIVTILPPARFSEAQLVFRMTVPYYRPDAGVGRLEIKGGNAEVQAIARRAMRGERHQIQFMVIFPPLDAIPRVKEIIINGKTFCSDTRAYPDTRSTIELKYALKTGLSLPVAPGSDFAIVSNNNNNINNNNNNNRPNRPDLVTIAILVPVDEARPMAPNTQPPSRPVGSGFQSPSKPIGSGPQSFAPPTPSRPIGSDIQSSRPIGAGSQSPPRPTGSGVQSSRPIGAGSQSPPRPTGSGVQSSGPIGSGGAGTDASNPPCRCNNTSSHHEANEKPGRRPSSPEDHHDFQGLNPPSSGVHAQNENGHPPLPQRPGASSGNSFLPATTAEKPNVFNHQELLDDKIYFIMAESDEVNSPRVVKLLEQLLIVAKKHYKVDLERLEIEKKRLELEKSPQYFIV